MFVGISGWWLAEDMRVADSATGQHILTALSYRDSVRGGDLLAPLREYHVYPPLVHLVGMLGLLVGNIGYAAPIMAANLVFAPLLALGCFGAGSVAYDRRVGALAAVFALGTPMVIAHFHVFMLDVPLAAMVAVSVWLILASDRFARVGVSAVAGVAAGLGMMTKSTFALFVATLIAVVLVRGGWRNWRGVAVFTAIAVAIAAPWYIDHLSHLTDLTAGAVNDPGVRAQNPPRWSLKNAMWYADNAFEHQLYLPLAALVLVGAVAAARRWRRRADDYAPELILGGAGGYVAMTALNIKDPRYTLPCLVFAAVLATAWMLRDDRRLRLVPVLGLAAIVIVNTLVIDFGVGGASRLSLPGHWAGGFLRGEVTLYGSPQLAEDGRDSPRDDGVRALLEQTKKEGARQVYLGPRMDNWRDYSPQGMILMARMIGLTPVDTPQLGPRDPIVMRHYQIANRPPPCLRLEDGSGVYLARRGPNPFLTPFKKFHLYCPGRRAAGAGS
jgi:hypothetical protein